MKKLLFPVVAVFLGLVAGLLLLEVVLRIAGVDPIGGFLEGRDLVLRPSDDPDLGYELVPGADGVAFETRIRVNSAGFRDREHAREKPGGTRRLLVLGDSITFGNSLPREERFPEILEELYREEGEPVEVLNLGVAGYDTVQEVAFLEKVGLAFDPDVVLVAYCINDAGVHSASLPALRVMERYGAWIRRSRLLQVLFVRIDARALTRDMESENRDPEFRRTYGDRIESLAGDTEVGELMRTLRSHLGAKDLGPAERFLRWHTSTDKIGRLRWAFRRLARLADERGFRAAVTIVPYLDEGDDPEAFRRAYAVVEHEVEHAGLTFVGVHDDLAEIGLERMRGEGFNPLHPGPEGHRLIAELLHEKLDI